MVKGVNLTLYEFYHDKKKIEKKNLQKSAGIFLIIQQTDGLDVSGLIPIIRGHWTLTQARGWS